MSAALNQQRGGSAEMARMVDGLTTKSEKIRVLAKAGYSRSQIADFLGIRYQHVRNVLVNDERVASGAAAREEAQASEAATDAPRKRNLRVVSGRVEPGGHVTIPPEYLQALGLEENDTVILSLENDRVELMSWPASVRRAQEIVRRFVPPGVSLVDEFLAERRQEAQREDGNG